MKIGFVGLGNVGGKLANNLLENNFQISVLDKNHILMAVSYTHLTLPTSYPV